MAIKLEVQPYCESCCDFEADVTKPERTTLYGDGVGLYTSQTDTIVKCKYANRCANLVRYLNRQSKWISDEKDYFVFD